MLWSDESKYLLTARFAYSCLFFNRLGLIESARRHLQAAGLQDDTRDAQSLQTIQRHISRCIEARKVGNWRIVLQESSAAVAAGAESAPQVCCLNPESTAKQK